MSNQLTIPETIDVGHVSAALATLYTSKKALFGGTVIRTVPPLQIQIISDVLEWGYDSGVETDQVLRNVAGYLYWMSGKFQLQAQNIISGPGGGSVVPTPSGGGQPNGLDFIVSATSIIPTGGASIYLDGTNGTPDLRGYEIDFFRSNTPQYTTPQPGSAWYYAWNNVTALFTLLPAGSAGWANEGEPFRISPKTGGGGTVTPTVIFPFVVTSADFEADGVTILDSRITGNTVYLQVNNTPNPFLFAPTDFIYVSGGIEIVLENFDANTFDYTIAINKIN